MILKAGREKSLKRRHPWIFSGAVAKVQGSPGPGETVEVHSADGEFLAVAAYSPQSQIVARAWDWEKRAIDGAFFEERVEQAVACRRALMGDVEAVLEDPQTGLRFAASDPRGEGAAVVQP